MEIKYNLTLLTIGQISMKRISTEISLKRMVWWAIMSASLVVGRILFAVVPNVQPVTAMIILISLWMSPLDGAVVAVLTILLSNLLLGFGLWTIPQIVAYLAIVGITWLLAPILRSSDLFIGALFASVMGFFYGFFISLIQAPFLGISAFWAYYLGGIPFDTYHALGNLGFYVLLCLPFRRVVDLLGEKNTRKRFEND